MSGSSRRREDRLKMKNINPIRILIVEDSETRIERLKRMLPDWVRPVVAVSAGKAIGILELDSYRRNNGIDVFAGILLDHDLVNQTITEEDRTLTGKNVVQSIIHNVTRDTPVLVHSMNSGEARVMVGRLENMGYSVLRVPMNDLTQEILTVWLEETRQLWEDRQE